MKAHTLNTGASAKRWLAIGMLMAMILLIAAVPAYAAMATDEFYPDDTDGTEMQLMEPAQLELYFGPEWAGAQFTLETDVGSYPGTIPVANDGSMRMEIGGSHTYVLRLVSGATGTQTGTVGVTGTEQAPAPLPEGSESEVGVQTTAPAETQTAEEQSGGVPLVPIIIFLAGLVIAAGILVAVHFLTKRKAEDEYDDDDEEE